LTRLLYQFDSYLKEFEATVIEVSAEGVILDQTAFHPTSGGVANDTGYLVKGEKRFRVIDVRIDKVSSKVIHVVDPAGDLSPGDRVIGVIDWDRRYRLMRLHTAAHIISAIFYRDYGALITGGNIYPDYAYDDYSLEAFDRRIFEDVIEKANNVARQGIEVKIYWLKRDEALKIPGIVKLASRLPPDVEELRIVEIPGVDIQADGGPHVKNTSEIGVIKMIRAENKGKKRKRLYYTVEP